MTKCRLNLLVLGVLLAVASLTFAQTDKEGMGTSHTGTQTPHVMVTPSQMKWGPAPPSLPAGARMAVLEGDPSQEGAPFTLRVIFPNGYMIPPHWHPTAEHVIVLKGRINLGIGEKFDRSVARIMPEGSFMVMPQGTRHFAWTRGETMIQVYGIGPFAINYVNPGDDPRNKSGR